jgi:hypothetical protein
MEPKALRNIAAEYLRKARRPTTKFELGHYLNLAQTYKNLAHDEECRRREQESSRPSAAFERPSASGCGTPQGPGR